MHVRDARIEDAASLASLAGELGYSSPAAEMRARLEVLLPHRDRRILVAEDDGAILGWIEAEERLTLDSSQRVEILGLVVGTTARRRGVGAALVSAAEAWARALAVGAVTVRSNVLRAESHPFYERMGFARTKTQHYYRKRLD
ncbi:GNAT family N-acetyltransferase [Vulgatibacter incomptus]|uniref:Acetyltransferase, GNAT family n=1 Tax=Vulgatibacter incomptus TaxID=1391653 RepID=A0A0K1PHX7_9BACT|nr:GNAT family N-acetyltransferase [Vulgatibacter incomptus]AKU93130.1 acetyltransferase, GNAT family [Vulgatibacter incomptus]